MLLNFWHELLNYVLETPCTIRHKSDLPNKLKYGQKTKEQILKWFKNFIFERIRCRKLVLTSKGPLQARFKVSTNLPSLQLCAKMLRLVVRLDRRFCTKNCLFRLHKALLTPV